MAVVVVSVIQSNHKLQSAESALQTSSICTTADQLLQSAWTSQLLTGGLVILIRQEKI